MGGLKQALRFVQLPTGARIAWASTGRGPTLVRAAHWMTHVQRDVHSPFFGPWVERLSASTQFVRYDPRGCGLSESDAVPPGLQASVDELAAVVEATGRPKVALLGLSAGAATVIAYAATRPERVERIVLCGGYARGTLARPVTDAQRRYFEASAQLIETGWGRRNPAVLQLFATMMIPDANDAQKQALVEQQRSSCDGARAAAMLRSNATIDVAALLPAVRCPALVMHCSGDAAVPLDESRLIAAAIPGARFEPLESNNHLPMAGEPAFDAFCDAVAEFVRESAAPEPLAGGAAFAPRERQLMELVSRGLDNLQIAARLGLAEKTVRNALSRLYAKLGVEGRSQAIVRLRQAGFGGD
jgi:pimeloyl-ACP methyl ester carboxylesterase